MFGNLGEMSNLLRNAGRIRQLIEQATESLGDLHVEGTAAGGGVTAKVNGRLEVLSVRLDPKLVAEGDVELLEDLVAAAVNQALVKAREAGAQSMREATGVAGIPGLDAMFGPGGSTA